MTSNQNENIYTNSELTNHGAALIFLTVCSKSGVSDSGRRNMQCAPIRRQ